MAMLPLQIGSDGRKMDDSVFTGEVGGSADESCSDQGSRWLSDVASELEAAFEQIRNRRGEKPGTSFSPQVAACVAL